jgi:hypothetical protein
MEWNNRRANGQVSSYRNSQAPYRHAHLESFLRNRKVGNIGSDKLFHKGMLIADKVPKSWCTLISHTRWRRYSVDGSSVANAAAILVQWQYPFA